MGAGRSRNGLGPFLARDLEAAGCAVTAVIGRDPERTAAAAAELVERHGHPVQAHTDAGAALAATAPDALIVAAPIVAHRRGLEAALQHRVAVLCEKPLVAPEEHDSVAALLDGFAEQGLLLMENCQWPHALRGLDRLLPGARQRPPERVEMLLAPSGTGRAMVVDTLSHLLSVLQMLVAIGGETRLGRVAFSGLQPDATRGTVELELESPFPRLRSSLYLERCATQPRPAWVAVDGRRVERQIDMSDYSMSLCSEDQSMAIEDPLTLLVRDFVHNLREPDLDRVRAESDLIRQRARIYGAVLDAFDRGQ